MDTKEKKGSKKRKREPKKAKKEAKPKKEVPAYVPLHVEFKDATEDKEWYIGGRHPVGVDEVGRGSWVGNVMAVAATVRTRGVLEKLVQWGIKDSKKMSKKELAAWYDRLMAMAPHDLEFSIGEQTHIQINENNILQATLTAMTLAVYGLNLPVETLDVRVDGSYVPAKFHENKACRSQAIVKGDDREPLISAASIVAKVTRDRQLAELAKQYPHYDWETNAGYHAPKHVAGLKKMGRSPLHREWPCTLVYPL